MVVIEGQPAVQCPSCGLWQPRHGGKCLNQNVLDSKVFETQVQVGEELHRGTYTSYNPTYRACEHQFPQRVLRYRTRDGQVHTTDVYNSAQMWQVLRDENVTEVSVEWDANPLIQVPFTLCKPVPESKQRTK